MDKEEIRKLFNEFLENYDLERHQALWQEQSNTFREFWRIKILAHGDPLVPERDYDPIIRLLDINARGFRRETDEAVARVGLRQGVWYRIFNDLKEKANIRATLDEIFKSDEEPVLIRLINRLEEENADNKNGLTGKNANALNALLFINNPIIFLSSVSLSSHRFQIMKAFGFGNGQAYETYGEKIIGSNRDIIAGFKEKVGLEAASRTMSQFFYFPPIRSFWQKAVGEEDRSEEEEPQTGPSEAEFVIEKHLEDFLVANWESTELGKLYDLIQEEDGKFSQQYRTDIGLIDLLVRDRRDGCYVVIELKKGQTSDGTIGQLARYMGWVKKHKADGGKVKGIIIAGSDDKRLKYALGVVPDTEVLLYRVSFLLERPSD